ncbi:ArsR/SmtB family transcription factor [Cellulomonas palmilytica]|uniref:ArsR/SmtB family transcription factor n=1 Tax=Cellulomonas palmilytica TaxID=2608402 RepID=UPI001F440C24|nr:metalloregulator ArsR/SmtB family transcription factor [Cellulomonas palmilytica]UJP41113.1 helix-turn-helix transcriptional regulator [Cellulomonas palmilytica]
MLNHDRDAEGARLDAVFRALSDASRRTIVERLVRGPATVGTLAAPLDMSLPAVLQHLAVLESAGIVQSQKIGRVRTCTLVPGALVGPTAWLAGQRLPAERRLDRLGDHLTGPAAGPPPQEQS